MSAPARPTRDYRAIEARLERSPLRAAGGREAAMQRVVDALWEGLHDRGVSWVGFYTKAAGADEMILGPRRDKPACSPIGLHGVCGRCWASGRAIVVRDVAELGAGYIACDPRDRSEVAVPMLEADGTCWGVLDVDSLEIASFDETDAAWLARIAERAGLSAPGG